MTDDNKNPWQVPNSKPKGRAKPSPWGAQEPEKTEEHRYDRNSARDWDYQYDYDPEPMEPRQKKRGFWRLVIYLAILVALYLYFSGGSSEEVASDPYAWKYIIIALIFGGSMVYFSRTSTSTALKNIAIWGLIIAIVSGFYMSVYDPDWRQNGPENSTMVADNGVIEVERSRDGHFWVMTEINGVSLPMMVDTGASMVVLSMEDARYVGFDMDRLVFDGRSSTANGTVSMATTRISQFKVGSTGFRNFEVAINGGSMRGSLLGMDAINQFSSFEISGDTMRFVP